MIGFIIYIDYTTSVYSFWVTTLVKNWVAISDYITMIFQFPFLSLNIVHRFERLMIYSYKPAMQCYVYPSLYPLHHMFHYITSHHHFIPLLIPCPHSFLWKTKMIIPLFTQRYSHDIPWYSISQLGCASHLVSGL